MGNIVVTEYGSLDGVMEGPGGGEDYKHVGWTFEFNRGEDGDQFKLDETLGSEALLLGRITYEGFAAAWPSMSGDVRQEVIDLKRRIDGDIVAHGSAQLVQALLDDDLVDELRLMVFPIVLGTGTRLFGETTDKNRMQLVDSNTVGDGITMLTLRRAA